MRHFHTSSSSHVTRFKPGSNFHLAGIITLRRFLGRDKPPHLVLHLHRGGGLPCTWSCCGQTAESGLSNWVRGKALTTPKAQDRIILTVQGGTSALSVHVCTRLLTDEAREIRLCTVTGTSCRPYSFRCWSNRTARRNIRKTTKQQDQNKKDKTLRPLQGNNGPFCAL
jgi:hypothetical protein